jgi:O-antigen ligase
MFTSASPRQPSSISTLAGLPALTLPFLLAFNLPPSSTFLNQVASLFGWGIFLVAGTAVPSHWARSRARGGSAIGAAVTAIVVAAFATALIAGLPWSLALSGAAFLLASTLISQVAIGQSGRAGAYVFRSFCIGITAAASLSSLVGLIQVFAPSLADGNFIARTYIDGRAVGNMRQPNHLSSLLLWAVVASVWLGEARVLRRWGSTLLALLFIFVVVLTASRTGALSMLLLAAWGLLDRRLSREARWLLALSPLLYAAFWYGTGVWADSTHHVFGGETRFSTQGDVSSSRIGIWANTLTLIRMHPWFGVGWGEFNFAWTLTPFPGRPVAFFDHTHNLILQFVVELGIPLALLVLGLMGYALWVAARAALQPAAADAAPGEALVKPAAFAMVLLILVHSMLEYPLWYAYYLLPASFAFGLCLSGDARAAPAETGVAAAPPRRVRPLVVASLLLAMGGAASVLDYMRVVAIYAPWADSTATLDQRIASGRRSIFFAHHADYAAATTAPHPGRVLPAFIRAPHYLLDARLLQAWATALDESGQTDKARYVAQRLREFRNEQSAEFFAPCAAGAAEGKALPFQCLAPERAYTYEDFR